MLELAQLPSIHYAKPWRLKVWPHPISPSLSLEARKLNATWFGTTFYEFPSWCEKMDLPGRETPPHSANQELCFPEGPSIRTKERENSLTFHIPGRRQNGSSLIQMYLVISDLLGSHRERKEPREEYLPYPFPGLVEGPDDTSPRP